MLTYRPPWPGISHSRVHLLRNCIVCLFTCAVLYFFRLHAGPSEDSGEEWWRGPAGEFNDPLPQPLHPGHRSESQHRALQIQRCVKMDLKDHHQYSLCVEGGRSQHGMAELHRYTIEAKLITIFKSQEKGATNLSYCLKMSYKLANRLNKSVANEQENVTGHMKSLSDI